MRLFYTFISFLLLNNSYSQAPPSLLEWAKGINTSNNLMINSVASDLSNNVYIAGNFEGIVDFDPSENETLLESFIEKDAFYAKYSSDGELLWVKQITEPWEIDEFISAQSCNEIIVDNENNIIITGGFQSVVDFDPGMGENIISSEGSVDIFILKISPEGELIWVKTFGDWGLDVGKAVAVDSENNIYIGGLFNETIDFDTGPGIFELTSLGVSDDFLAIYSDCFILKMTEDGNFLHANNIGSENGVFLSDMVVDNDQNLYLIGNFTNIAFFDPLEGAITLETSSSYDDIFISKMDNDGDFLWAKQFGGTDYDLGVAIAIDPIGNIYGTGGFRNTSDFDPSEGEYLLTSSGNYDIFVNKLTNNGDFVWTNHLVGGLNGELGSAIYVSSDFEIYLTGLIRGSMDFDPGLEEYILISEGGENNGFLEKIDSAGQLIFVEQIKGENACTDFVVNFDQSVYLTGYCFESIDLDFGGEIETLETSEFAGYLLKIDQGFATLNEEKSKFSVSLFPNPASTIIKVGHPEPFKIVFFNELGEVILEENKNDIDISNLDEGIYFVQIFDQNFELISIQQAVVMH